MKPANQHLFESAESPARYQPLAARMRPHSLETFVGQNHLLGPGKPLYEAIENKSPHSMILWGPPGVGKTTLAGIVAKSSDSFFVSLSAVTSGIKDIRSTVEQAQQNRQMTGQATLLFVDEVHRFNKSQQDAFLPHIEDGTLLFVGATTENPAFELNNALLSRARTYVLTAITAEDLALLVQRALADEENGLGKSRMELKAEQVSLIAWASDGDARRCLNFLDILCDLAAESEFPQGQDSESLCISDDLLAQVVSEDGRRFDKGGDMFYEQISALHKAIRGSAPDASLYWFMRMLDGGCDPVYIARRLLRISNEDIGLADPRAQRLCLDSWDTYLRLGSPEGELALAQAVIYLATAAKSNAVYKAFAAARESVRAHGSLDVPMHLRNASTALTDSLGYGEGYRYAHDEELGFAAGENYFPEALKDSRFYTPSDRGLEQRIHTKLEHLRSLDQASRKKRYK